MSQESLRFVHRNALVEQRNVPSDRTLLELLRDDLHCTAVKEGCASGDCGACTVTLAEIKDGGLEYRAINSCIRLAHSIDGMALWTAQDIAAEDGRLHPAQQAMVECHGSQCGFCTPGFVMSLFTLQQQRDSTLRASSATQSAAEPLSRDEVHAAISGNLCRCTGYRPIVDAAMTMHHWAPVPLNEVELHAQLKKLNTPSSNPDVSAPASALASATGSWYEAPRTLDTLLALRATHQDAQLVAGCTDVGLWVTKGHQHFERVIDVTRVDELQRLTRDTDGLNIGAAVTLQDAFEALQAERPQLAHFFDRFAGLPVRQSGTMGGNVANGSPIGDSMPLLIALGATLNLASVRGRRSVAIEDFYLGYRKSDLAPDEVLVSISVPHPTANEVLRAYKISKRFEDDISAVCLCVSVHAENGVIRQARVGAGGVAAVPARALQTESALVGKPLSTESFAAAAQILRAEFNPISDMRASSAYRREVLGNLLLRFAEEVQPGAPVSLAELRLEDLA